MKNATLSGSGHMQTFTPPPSHINHTATLPSPQVLHCENDLLHSTIHKASQVPGKTIAGK